MIMEGTGNLFGYEGWGITSGSLGEVGGVGLEIFMMTADLLLPDGQRKGLECLVDDG